jgi:hypothetical protein
MIFLSALLSAASGSVAGMTFSRNRGGGYVRARVVPVTNTSIEALAAKARLGTVSGEWQGETDLTRDAWTDWAQEHPVTNALGLSKTLSGHGAYVGINTRLDALAFSKITNPPVVAPPVGLLTAVGTFDIGAGTTEIAFTDTPLAAEEHLYIRAAKVASQGIEYVDNLLVLIGKSSAAQASPFDYQALLEARLGTMIVGEKVVLLVSVVNSASGLLSRALRTEGTVVSTI